MPAPVSFLVEKRDEQPLITKQSEVSNKWARRGLREVSFLTRLK